MQISSMETLAWKNGCTPPVGNFSSLVVKVTDRPTFVREHANASRAGDGKRRSNARIPTIEKTNSTARVRGVLATQTTGAYMVPGPHGVSPGIYYRR